MRNYYIYAIIALLVAGGIYYIVPNNSTTIAPAETETEEPQPSEREYAEVREELEQRPFAEFFTSEEAETKVKAEIAAQHAFWNRTLGFGGINNLSVSKRSAELEERAAAIRANIIPHVRGALAADMEIALAGIENAKEDNRAEALRIVHRIFHDLDIVLNRYSGDTTYFGVTETLTE